MKPLRPPGYVLALTLALASSLFAAAPSAERLLPSDVLGFVSVPSWDAAAAAFRRDAYGQLWADPAMRPFREKFQVRLKTELLDPLQKELGLNLTNYARLFQGQVTLAFTPTSASSQPGQKSGFLCFADTGANSAQLATNLAAWRKKWTDADKQAKSVKIRDLDFTTLVFAPDELNRLLDRLLPNPDPTQAASQPAAQAPRKAEWTIGQSGPLFILSDSPKDIEKLLVLQSGGGLSALADLGAYTADAPHFRDAHAFGWLNLKAIFERLAKDSPPASSGGPDSEPGSISAARMLSALGLDGLQTLAVNLQESGRGTLLSLRLKVPDSARHGLWKILAFEAKDSSPPPFIPADTVKFNRLRLNLPKSWSALEATLADLSPPAASLLKFIFNTAGKDTDEKFDLRQHLIAQLGDDIISCEKFPRSSAARDYQSPPSLLLVGARDASQVATAGKAIAGLLPSHLSKYKEREFLGRSVYSFTWPASSATGEASGGFPLHYAASGGYLALSTDPALVEEFLRSNEGQARALRDKPGLPEAAQVVGGMSTGFFALDNSAESARAFFEVAKKDSLNAAALLSKSALGSRLGMGRDGGLFALFDFSSLPPFERVAKYFHFDVSALSAAPDGYTFRLFAPTPPQLKN